MPFNNFGDSEKDRVLFEKVSREAINLFGIKAQYLTVAFDATKEALYSEDTKPLVNGVYKIVVYTEVIQEDWMLSRFGFQSDDLVTINISETEFTDSIGRDPQVGDYVWIDYMSRLFAVTDVDQESNVFHQKKFIWDIHLKSADINGEELMAGVDFTNYETIVDNQNDNTTISNAASGLVIEKPNDKDIFGGWN